MTLTVKRWIADQKMGEMKARNYFPTCVPVNGYYADTENDTVTFDMVEVVKETEKAIQVALDCGNYGGKEGSYIVWFPKSQIIK